MAESFGLLFEKVRLTLGGVGGAFGGREDLSMQIHACMLALHTGRPVRMAYNREESFYGHVHRHPCTMRYEHGATRDGRLVFVRALLGDPELLILDEPTGGVDPEAQTSFYALLHHLNREREVTLILVSHDIGVVAKEVTRLACLNRRLIFHGRPGDFLSDAALAALYGPAVRVVSHEH